MLALSDIAWIFVCQSGRLEREACVLAASMRRILGPSANLIAAIPQPELVMGTVLPESLEFLRSIDVRLQAFVNDLVDGSDEQLRLSSNHARSGARSSEPNTEKSTRVGQHQCDLMMNKAFALRCDQLARVSVFLDSDQLCFAALDLVNFAVPMVGRKVFYPGAAATAGIWQRAYEICEVEMPKQRLLVQSRVPTEPAIVSPPCFNSGLISVHRPWSTALVDDYLDCYRRIRQHNLLGEHRYFSEQTALALAVIKCGVPYEIDNHRIDRSLFHYYSLSRLATFTHQARLVASLVDEYEGLRRMLADDQEWQRVIVAGRS